MVLGLLGACSPKAPPEVQTKPGSLDAVTAPESAPMSPTTKHDLEPEADEVPEPGEEFEVALGQRVPLTADVDITFTGNAHKLSEGNVDSTVGVSFTVHHPDRDEPWDGWIDTSRPSTFTFTVAGVELEMVDYRYDGWIRLRIK